MITSDQDVQAALERMRLRAAQHGAQWQRWISDRPQSRICVQHQFLRVIDCDRSMAESWVEKRNLAIYRPCAQCEKETAAKLATKPARKRKARKPNR